ncbi:MAG: hypothetical protein KKH22_07140 [Proteobacteria bacterium]|nr:hypothetical protein [Pseudomonadota bacterium]
MKNHVAAFWVSMLLFGAVLTGCAASNLPTSVGIETEKEVSLPLIIEKVWYRTEKVRVFGLAFEESGTLTVSDGFVEFVHEKGKIKIPRETIQKVTWGKLSPDITNDWVIVHYTDSGKGMVAAFKGSLLSGTGKESKIYSAILHIMNMKAKPSPLSNTYIPNFYTRAMERQLMAATRQAGTNVPPGNPDDAPPPGNPDDAPPPGNPDDAPPGKPDDAPPPGNPDDAPPGNPDDAPPPPNMSK